MAEAENPGPATRFREAAMSVLRTTTQDHRESLTRDSEVADVWLIVAPGRTLYETGWKFPVNLANCIFTNHRILEIRKPSRSIFISNETVKVLEIVYRYLPRDPTDIKYALAWLEFYASEGEPPQIHPRASRSYLRRHLQVAQQLGVSALEIYLSTRIQELTSRKTNHSRMAQPSQGVQRNATSNSIATTPSAATRPAERRSFTMENLHHTHMHSIQTTYAHDRLESYVRSQNDNASPQAATPEVGLRHVSDVAPAVARINGSQHQPDPSELDHIESSRQESQGSHQNSIQNSESFSTQQGLTADDEHAQLPTSAIRRSPHTPANSAISRARSHVNENTNSNEHGNHQGNGRNGITNGIIATNEQTCTDATDNEQ